LASSTEVAPGSAARALAAYLTGTEGKGIADRLEAGESLTAALSALPKARQPAVKKLLVSGGLLDRRAQLVLICRSIEGARSTVTRVDPLWTMPGHLAQTGPLTSSVPQLIAKARVAITCSTFNFQESSALWTSLRTAAQQLRSGVKVYVDTRAAESKGEWVSPSPADIATHLRPGQVFQTRVINGKAVRNHAKYLIVDHRFVLVTSANFSRSAEFDNIEFGVRIDAPNLAEAVERELSLVESTLFERVKAAR
jgi:hypothetical protein